VHDALIVGQLGFQRALAWPALDFAAERRGWSPEELGRLG
jgi:hypothetical protein